MTSTVPDVVAGTCSGEAADTAGSGSLLEQPIGMHKTQIAARRVIILLPVWRWPFLYCASSDPAFFLRRFSWKGYDGEMPKLEGDIIG